MAKLSKAEKKTRQAFKRLVMAAVMRDSGGTQKGLAEQIGCTECQLSYFFNGTMRHTDTALMIAERCAEIAELEDGKRKAYASVGRIVPG
ncbi:hypothetical protein LCGC14_1092070 [marine sediment metagenome]|uniref:HTH cro/C1-type domain-containing protein n=1 Tax=marine sediment metagenome TaxID=412755 RepID=A0A0F9QI46_9ZZZZ